MEPEENQNLKNNDKDGQEEDIPVNNQPSESQNNEQQSLINSSEVPVQQANQNIEPDDLLGSINNNIFLSENTLETLYTILFSKGSYLDEITFKDGKLEEKFGCILRGRHTSLLSFLGDKMQFYHSKLIDGELSHLEKLMKILRSKKREMRLKRVENIQESENLAEEEKNEENMNNSNNKQKVDETKDLKRPRSKSFVFDQPSTDPPVSTMKRINSCMDMNFSLESEVLHEKKDHLNGYQPQNLLSFNDLSELTSLNIFKRKLMREYNPADNSFSFKLNNRYLVTMKSFEEKSIDKTSFFHQIPYSVMQNYIFPCFSAYGLFYLRQVSSEWRELIRSMWHKTFQREMHEQLYAADLCQEIECNFRLIALRTPFVHKFAIFLKALAEILDWQWVNNVALSTNDKIDKRVKMIFYGIFKILGNRPMTEINNLNDLTDEIWDQMKISLLDNSLRNDMNNVIDSEYYFDANSDLMKIREKFISAYSISMSNLNDVEDKNNVVILNIFLKQLFLFALLKNSVFIGQKFLYYVKDVLKKISDSWPQKKGFLEGAYKILLFKNIKFVDGQIVVAEEEETFDASNENEDHNDKEDYTKNNFLNLMNNFKDPNKPDFVIKKKGTETRIYLDDATKAELILNSILSFSTQSLGKLINLATETKQKIERINEEIKKEEDLKKETLNQEQEALTKAMINQENEEETLKTEKINHEQCKENLEEKKCEEKNEETN